MVDNLSSSPAKEYDNGVTFRWDETQEEYVLCTAIVAFRRCLAQGRVGMKGDFFVLCSYEMVYNVASGCRTS